MSPLEQQLSSEIAQRGSISFRDFMARALYDPGHGYYGAGKARVGRGGDFFTNVSVGPLFGRLLARQFVEMWRRLGEPAEFVLVEQGAHRGDCAADVLTALREFDPACFAATTFWLVEPLAQLRQIQGERLRDFGSEKVRWAEALTDLPPFRGVHYSNELVDAFPVHRVSWRGDRWMERCVDFQEGRFVFVDAEISSETLRAHLTSLPPVPTDYETEVNLAVAPWLAEVESRLQAGFILAIDYGYPREEYYRPERTTGTLSAYAAHQREPDPLLRPGEIDLTAHVDFTTLAETAAPLGLQLTGFTDQHHFMVGLSRLHFPDDQALSAASQKELRAFKTLMHPGLMGRSFHAICLAKGTGDPALTGFQFGGDPRRKLLPA
ncbi:MAG: SAM-dependent methyltransferase [Chthoniobacter sp.]|uniref:class I SAM-dependent methyltransferase n=1 Tax=Chthoniobacter sp. TaxID=2510640 RepID=UPI0032A60EC7